MINDIIGWLFKKMTKGNRVQIAVEKKKARQEDRRDQQEDRQDQKEKKQPKKIHYFSKPAYQHTFLFSVDRNRKNGKWNIYKRKQIEKSTILTIMMIYCIYRRKHEDQRGTLPPGCCSILEWVQTRIGVRIHLMLL